MTYKKGAIQLTVEKTQYKKKVVEPLEPSTRRLLESVDGFLKFAHMRWFMQVSKPGWLGHVHILAKNTIQERITNIELLNVLRERLGKSQDRPNGRRFYRRTKSLIKVDTLLLCVSLSDQLCLVVLDVTIRTTFDFKDPTTTNDSHFGSTRHQGPRIIFVKSIYLFGHGLSPLGEMNCFVKMSRLEVWRGV